MSTKGDKLKKISARGIVVKQGKVLLIHRKKPSGKEFFAIPGGKVDPGESPEHTVVREVYEETSIKVKIDKMLGVYSDQAQEQHIFLCSFLEGKPMLSLGSNEWKKMQADPRVLYDPVWMDIEEALLKKIQPEITEKAFKEYIQRLL